MEWSFELLSAHGIVRATTRGKFSLSGQRRMFEEIAAFDGFKPGAPILFDNRAIDMRGADTETIRQSVGIMQDFIRRHSRSRIAGLVRHDLNFGYGRQFEMINEFGDESDFRLFDDELVAIEWLILPSIVTLGD